MEVAVPKKNLLEGEDFGVIDPKAIPKILFVIGIIAMVISVGLIIGEISEAKDACINLDGNYSLRIYPPQHLCNRQNFSRYSSGEWDFDSNRHFQIDLDR